MRLKYRPHTLIVDQTVLCNEACFFCWRSDAQAVREATLAAPHKTMPADLYRRIIDEAGAVESVANLSLCGPMGDPSLVEDLAERGAYARASGHFPGYVIINTNGFALDRHDPEDLLLGFTGIHISLDSVDPATHERIHGKAGHLERILANIEALVAAKRRRGGSAAALIQVRFTDNDLNAGQWPDFHAAVTRLGVDAVLHKTVHSFIDVLPEMGGETGARLCEQPHRVVNVDYRGRLTTCCVNWKQAPTFGQLGEAPLRDLWEGEAFEAWRESRHGGLCKGCSGLPGTAVLRGQVTAEGRHALQRMAAVGENAFRAEAA